MDQKRTINLSVRADVADAFDQVSRFYGHGKQKGMVLGAAMLLFVETQPTRQAQYVKRIATAQIDLGAKQLGERLRLTGAVEAGRPQRIAAKPARKAVGVVKRLPRPGRPRTN